MLTGVKRWKANSRSEKVNNLKINKKQIKQNLNLLLNYKQTLKPQNLLHKWQKFTKTQRQLTINNKEKVTFW